MSLLDVDLYHHYGWRRYSVDAADLEAAAYAAIRQTHHFLTDDNHRYAAGERTLMHGDTSVSFKSVRVYRECNTSAIGLGQCPNHWFFVRYRAPTTSSPAIASTGGAE